MGIVRATAYPSLYKDEEWLKEEALSETQSVGKFYLQFDAMKAGAKRYIGAVYRQREIAKLVGRAIQEKPRYDRIGKYYCIGKWSANASDYGESVNVFTGLFDIDNAEKTLRVMDTLQAAGYIPDDEVTIYFKPNVYDFKLISNLCNIMEARNALIMQALGLNEEIRIVVDEELAFGIPLSAFSFEKIEACVYLLQQASLMAANTSKARMKPCDGSNPKYQMRTWLLRLGFIGDQYARPRQTLIGGLEGDVAFYTDDGKEKAAMKRKAKRMAG